jgi:hypothetical protein
MAWGPHSPLSLTASPLLVYFRIFSSRGEGKGLGGDVASLGSSSIADKHPVEPTSLKEGRGELVGRPDR